MAASGQLTRLGWRNSVRNTNLFSPAVGRWSAFRTYVTGTQLAQSMARLKSSGSGVRYWEVHAGRPVTQAFALFVTAIFRNFPKVHWVRLWVHATGMH